MMTLKKILVPVDFSEYSLNALRYAAALSRTSGASIIILHVADPGSLVNDLKGNLAPEHMLNLLKESDYLAGIGTQLIMEKGDVSGLILELSQKNDVDLVVMGTRGAGSSLSRSLVGTNTTRVVGKSNCMVLAVPQEAGYRPVTRVVCAVDLEHRSDHILAEIVSLLKGGNPEFLLVFAGLDKDGLYQQDLAQLTDELKKKTGYSNMRSEVIPSEAFPDSLEKFAMAADADMLVMITHHRGVFEAIFDPSQTKMYAYHTRVPLLAVPHHKTPVYFF